MKGDQIEVTTDRGNVLPESIANRIEVVTESGCWLWIGACRDGGIGYGRVWFQKKSMYAHRIVYQLLVSDIPEDLTIDHLCRVRCCVNPHHMDVVSTEENSLRGFSPLAVNKRKTHCKNGHPFTDDNIVVRKTTSKVGYGRACLVCVREQNIQYQKERRKAIRADHPKPERALKSHCQNGHEFTPENTRIRREGSRVCRTCHKIRAKALYATDEPTTSHFATCKDADQWRKS